MAETRAANADLVRAVRAGDRAAASAVLARFLKTSNGMFASWCVADRNGMTLALEPFDPFPEKSYSYRDWFNGLGDQPERPGNPYPPIEHTHVSQPFVSTASKQNMVISVAAPVRDGGQTIGVLIGSVELAELNSWVTEVEIRDGFVSLFNERGQCLLHRAREQILPRPGQNPRSWLDAAPTYQDLLGARKADKAVLADPIDGKTYLASYAPMPDAEIGWGVIVQHDKAAAQQPIDDLWNGVIVSGVVTTVTVGLVISALWAWLIWLLWRKERLAYA